MTDSTDVSDVKMTRFENRVYLFRKTIKNNNSHCHYSIKVFLMNDCYSKKEKYTIFDLI